MKKKTKNILLGLVVVSVVLTWTMVFVTKKSAANHDYVCWTSDWSACGETYNWSAWNTDEHSRTGTSYRTRQGVWGNTRTGCPQGVRSGITAALYAHSGQGTCLKGSCTGTEEYSAVLACTGKKETDTTEPTCNFQTVNAGAQLQFKCTMPDESVARNNGCQNYTEWTDVDFAQPNEAKIIGVASEAGVYKGCVVPAE